MYYQGDLLIRPGLYVIFGSIGELEWAVIPLQNASAAMPQGIVYPPQKSILRKFR